MSELIVRKNSATVSQLDLILGLAARHPPWWTRTTYHTMGSLWITAKFASHYSGHMRY